MYLACKAKLSAELELARRVDQSKLTPQHAYDLFMLAYENEELALKAQTEILLASMPEPSNDYNYS